MKLLFLSEKYPPEIGGLAAGAGRLTRSLARIGHEVHVWAPVRDLPAGAVETLQPAERLTVHRFGKSRGTDFTMQQGINFLEWLHAAAPFDALWGHYLENAGFLAVWLGRRWGRPSVVSVRGNDLDRLLFPPGDFARLTWTLQSADRITTVSADLAGKVQTLSGRESFVLPNSVDPVVFSPGPKPSELAGQYGLQPGELVMAFSGELRAKKGLPFLIAAAARVMAARPARLLVIGEVRDRDLGEFERAVAAEPVVRERCVLTGHVVEPAEVARRLRLADVLLLPSLWEGMPNSLLEAMAAGVPVIASDAGGIPEVVTNGVNGVLLPKTHLHRLGDAVLDWAALPEGRRREMVAAARRTIEEHHSPAAEEAGLARLLTGLTA